MDGVALILSEGVFGEGDGKTANGLVRHTGITRVSRSVVRPSLFGTAVGMTVAVGFALAVLVGSTVAGLAKVGSTGLSSPLPHDAAMTTKTGAVKTNQ